jgi:hypothetical protein
MRIRRREEECQEFAVSEGAWIDSVLAFPHFEFLQDIGGMTWYYDADVHEMASEKKK